MGRDRIRGALGERMVKAALRALEPNFAWTSDNYGINQPLSHWKDDMRDALEAAFEELLKP